jgi:hypothetical protein
MPQPPRDDAVIHSTKMQRLARQAAQRAAAPATIARLRKDCEQVAHVRWQQVVYAAFFPLRAVLRLALAQILAHLLGEACGARRLVGAGSRRVLGLFSTGRAIARQFTCRVRPACGI